MLHISLQREDLAVTNGHSFSDIFQPLANDNKTIITI